MFFNTYECGKSFCSLSDSRLIRSLLLIINENLIQTSQIPFPAFRLLCNLIIISFLWNYLTHAMQIDSTNVVYFSLTYEDELSFISLSLFDSSLARWSIKQRVLRSFYLHRRTKKREIKFIQPLKLMETGLFPITKNLNKRFRIFSFFLFLFSFFCARVSSLMKNDSVTLSSFIS